MATRANPKEKPHYVNKKEFSSAVTEYVKRLNEARDSNNPLPIVTDYIANCFVDICEGLSHRPNFIRYTYRDEMVMDGVENCLRAIDNYDIDAATRSGDPNAFGYFTQIAWYAFLRRIAKEKRQYDIKIKYIAQGNIEDFIVGDENSLVDSAGFFEDMRNQVDQLSTNEALIDHFTKEEKLQNKKREKKVDSDLADFIGLNAEDYQ